MLSGRGRVLEGPGRETSACWRVAPVVGAATAPHLVTWLT